MEERISGSSLLIISGSSLLINNNGKEENKLSLLPRETAHVIIVHGVDTVLTIVGQTQTRLTTEDGPLNRVENEVSLLANIHRIQARRNIRRPLHQPFHDR